MRPPKNNPGVPVQFERHEPERRRGASGRLYCNGGCCCCCCCLHSLGGLIGAAVGATKGRSESAGPVAKCYWISLCVLVGGIVLYGATQQDGMFMAMVAALLLLPGLQLIASILTLTYIGIWQKDFPDRGASLRLLGKITLYAFLWALVAGLGMAAATMFH